MESLVTANVRQRPVRAVVSAAGVALGVCLVMLFTGLARGMSNDLQRRSQNLRAEIVFTPEAGPRVKMSLAAMQDALEAPGKCTWIYVKLKNPEAAVEMARRIDEQLPGNKIQLTRDIVTNIEKSIPYLGVFLRTLVGLSAVVSGLVVMLAMYTTITERSEERRVGKEGCFGGAWGERST